MIDEPSAQRNRSRWLRLVRGSAIALILLAVAWQVAKRIVDVDRYRPRIETALAEYTGLPVAIGSLELAWHPVPCLSAHDVSIGEGDFHAVTARLDVFPRVLALVRARLEIARIELIEPAVTLPAARAELESRWRRVIARVDAARGERAARADARPDGVKLRIDELLAESAILRFGQGTEHPIVSSISATGIGGEQIEFELDAEVPSTGARAEGTLIVPAHEGGDVVGELMISGVQPDAYAALPEFAHADWQAHAELSGKLASELALVVDGSFEPLSEQALGGTFTGHARIAPDGKTRAELEVAGEGFEVRSTARLFAGERSRVRIRSLRAHDAALATLLGAIARAPVDLRAGQRAALEVRDLEVSIASAPRLVSGVLEARGLELGWRGAPIARDLRLAASAAEGAIRIAELRGGPVDLRGVVTPDVEGQRIAVDLTGTIALDAKLLHALGAPEAIRAAHGAIALEELRAELQVSRRRGPKASEDPKAGPPDGGARYALRAQLSGGSLQIETEAIEESVSGIDLRLTGDDSALALDARAHARALGPVSVGATVDPKAGSASGSITIVDASANFVRNPGWRARLSPVLRAYSGAPLAFEIERSPDPPHVQRIRFERVPAPRVNAALVLRREPPKDPLRDLDVSADLPADALRGFLPEAAQASGTGSLRVRRSAGGAGFFGEADLAGVALADGDYLEKKSDEPLRVRAEGEAGERWDVHKLIVASDQDSFALAIGEGGVSASDLDVDLAAFSFLLVDGARAAGRVRGSLDSKSKSAQLGLDGVGLWLSPDLSVDAVDGAIAIAGDDWGVSDLHVRGAESDATLDAAVKQGRLAGTLLGERLDIEFVRAVFDQIRALGFAEPEPDTSPKISGQLAVALDRAGYGRAEVQRVAATIALEQDDVHVRDLAFLVGEGRVSGRADVDVRERPEPPLLDLEIDFADLSRNFLDDLLEHERRGKPGRFTGKLRFRAPLHDDLRATMASASGSLVGTGVDGALIGQIGLATKIVTVLRSTETLRMRLPTFQDEGLVFDTVRADLAMEQGRVEIRTFSLDSTSYAINATGKVNFRKDTSRVPIEVNAIRGITALIERVPVAGEALKIVNVRLIATGSPWDMQVRVASIQDQLLGAGLAGPKAVIKGVRDVLNLMRAAGGTLAPAPEPVREAPAEPLTPAPEAPAPSEEPPSPVEPPPAP